LVVDFDLAVIGGGPAGTSAAITAARLGARVALFEARSFPRHKVCGEFVSAEALQVLSELLGDPQSTASLLRAAPAIACARLWLGTRTLESRVIPAARSITRHDLDSALWSAAQAAGVCCREQCEVLAIEGDGPFRSRSAREAFAARSVIVAAGRWSQFAADRALPPGPKWIGVKAHFREHRPVLSTDLYFFAGGYCGVQPISAEAVNACAMVRSDCAASLPQVFERHPALRDRAAQWTSLTPGLTTAPLLYRAPQPVRGNIAFVGDAAAFIDPFVGDGISIALRSGQAAANCVWRSLADAWTLEDSLAAYARTYAAQFAPLLAAASRVRGLLALPGWAQMAAFEMLRLPGVMPFIIRRTRQASG
jgi:flavin-dependent dehydrogenase